MNLVFRGFPVALAAAAALVVGSAPAAAQESGIAFFSNLMAGGERGVESVTKISSDSMDIDIANNQAVFIGNVIVDDPQLTITCHEMTIELEDVGEEGSASKDISRIICVKDVVIARKLSAEEAEAGSQRAVAGRAEYNLKTGEIILTDNPVIMREPDSLRGERITIWRDSNRMKVEGGKSGSRIEIRSKQE